MKISTQSHKVASKVAAIAGMIYRSWPAEPEFERVQIKLWQIRPLPPDHQNFPKK